MNIKFYVNLETREMEYEGDDPTTDREAQAISVAKWTTIRDALKDHNVLLPAGSRFTCGFCMLHYENGCRACPVMKKTGERYCAGSPFQDFDGFTDIASMNDEDDAKHLVKLAEAEIAFLKSLEV